MLGRCSYRRPFSSSFKVVAYQSQQCIVIRLHKTQSHDPTSITPLTCVNLQLEACRSGRAVSPERGSLMLRYSATVQSSQPRREDSGAALDDGKVGARTYCKTTAQKLTLTRMQKWGQGITTAIASAHPVPSVIVNLSVRTFQGGEDVGIRGLTTSCNNKGGRSATLH